MAGRLDFKKVFYLSPNPYLLLNPDLTIAEANEAYVVVTGTEREDLIGRSVFEAFPGNPGDPEERNLQEFRSSLERVLAEGKPDTIAVLHYPIPRRSEDPETFDDRYWSPTNVPILDDEGNIEFILHNPVDVTELCELRSDERKNGFSDGTMPFSERVQGDILSRVQAVEESRRTLGEELTDMRRLFDQAPGFMAVLEGENHVFKLANQSYYQLVGHREIIGKPVREALPEIEGQGFFDLLDRVYERGEPFVGRERAIEVQRKNDGELEEAYVDFVYQPVEESDGSTSGIFVQGHDITERKLAQDELFQYKEQLEQLVQERTAELKESQAALRQAQKMEAIGNLTGGVAHDFNNLLQVIRGNLQFLQRELRTENGTETDRRLNSAAEAVERGAKLTSQLLAFGRRQPLEPKAVKVDALVSNMKELLQRTLDDSVAIEMVSADAVGNALIDPHRLENAILNLAINARDAMDGQGKLTIEVENTHIDDEHIHRHSDMHPGEYVLLTMKDTGCGMPAEDVERAFDPFFSTKSDEDGTGLGLSMVYGFVKQSNGHVQIDSKVGEGTTVRIHLPRTYEKEQSHEEMEGGTVTGGNETILVVEDDADVRRTVVEMLSELGYEVLQAQDAHSALEIVEKGAEFDMLFSDVLMPGPVRAPELAERAQERNPDVVILFTTGYTEQMIVDDGNLRSGLNLIKKPYSWDDLARKVRHLLDTCSEVDRRGSSGASSTTDYTTAQEESNAAESVSPLNILVVEDDPSIRLLIGETIELAGHRATSVSSGEKALEAFERHNFDVLFADVSLPGMSGIELARLLLEKKPDLKLIFASGHREFLNDAECERMQEALILQKPYTADQVEELLHIFSSN